MIVFSIDTPVKKLMIVVYVETTRCPILIIYTVHSKMNQTPDHEEAIDH